jgi:hypothetical protein
MLDDDTLGVVEGRRHGRRARLPHESICRFRHDLI